MGGFEKSNPWVHGSNFFFTQIPGSPPFLGVFEGFWTKSDLFQNVKKKWFRSLPFFLKLWFLKKNGSIFFLKITKNA
jgi:hypothetical protein